MREPFHLQHLRLGSGSGSHLPLSAPSVWRPFSRRRSGTALFAWIPHFLFGVCAPVPCSRAQHTSNACDAQNERSSPKGGHGERSRDPGGNDGKGRCEWASVVSTGTRVQHVGKGKSSDSSRKSKENGNAEWLIVMSTDQIREDLSQFFSPLI